VNRKLKKKEKELFAFASTLGRGMDWPREATGFVFFIFSLFERLIKSHVGRCD
jgi:hypothetical protein